jgi:hypothetical protein
VDRPQEGQNVNRDDGTVGKITQVFDNDPRFGGEWGVEVSFIFEDPYRDTKARLQTIVTKKELEAGDQWKLSS